MQMYIFSGPIHTGKTTKLEKWIIKNPDVDGILMPVINGRRYLYFIAKGETHLLETEIENPESFEQIGKYKFQIAIFQKAQNYLLGLIDHLPSWIVIDEIGFLELNKLGFEPAVSTLISKLNSVKDVNILLVVRDYLKDEVMDFYKLDRNLVKDFFPE